MTFKTQLMAAKDGETTPAALGVAQQESLSPDVLREDIAAGRVVIPSNRAHGHVRPVGIGRKLRTKINANIGNSSLSGDREGELAKLACAVKYGADTVMDLSTGEDLDEIRAQILAQSTVPVGTVPIYQALSQVGDPMDLSADLLLEVIEFQAGQGVDFMTVHAGLLKEQIPHAQRRLVGIVSRGGSILAQWMIRHGRENPLYVHFDRVLDICRNYDVTLSLGDGMRPGCLEDASDAAQFAELEILGHLVRRCRAAGVQAMVEGPGHIPLDEIEFNVSKERELCDDAPFYVLGPLVADCAPGYDHITAAIGGAWAAFHGAAMLCYVTPKEHLGLPAVEDVRAGVVASRIAAHAADVALRKPCARDRDRAISAARAGFEWSKQFELALDPERARELRAQSWHGPDGEGGSVPDALGSTHCTMCGPRYCAMRISGELGRGIGAAATGASGTAT